MADVLLASLKTLANEKRRVQELKSKEQHLASQERRIIVNLNRVLAEVGYRVRPVDGHDARSRGGNGGARTAPKRLHCPKCDRRFSHPLPMARHVSAMHGAKKKARG